MRQAGCNRARTLGAIVAFTAALVGLFVTGIHPGTVERVDAAAPARAGVPPRQPLGSAWPMFHGDAQHTGRSFFIGPQTGEVRWRSVIGGPLQSSPTIGADGQLYVTSGNGSLYAFGC